MVKVFRLVGTKVSWLDPVLVIGSVHLSLMSAIGVWVWSNPKSFSSNSGSCSLDASVVIIGQSAPLESDMLRVFSLMVYSTVLVPGFNLIFPVALVVLPYTIWNSKLWKSILEWKETELKHAVKPIRLGLTNFTQGVQSPR